MTLQHVKLNTASEQSSNAAHGMTSEQPSDAVHGTTTHYPDSCAHGTSQHSSDVAHGTSEHPSDAACGIHVQVDALQVPNVQIETAVALDLGSTVTNSVICEQGESKTGDNSSVEKHAAQENSDSVQNTASSSAGLMTTGRQANDLGSVEGKQTRSDPQKEDDSVQLIPHTGAVAVAELGDTTGHVGDSAEDRHLQDCVVERVSVA